MEMKNPLKASDITGTNVRVPVGKRAFVPTGRAKGSKNKLTLLREAVLEGQEEVILKHFPKIVDAVCKKAAGGDMTAAKLIMERLIAPKRDTVSQEDEQRKQSINIVINGAATFKPVETIIEGSVSEGE